ncbi:substrate-binding periplasmic protein [Shewanella litorisediminis]|uniref:ABC transporter substrate-binding protein n=1 Tax=Shewanella litorisediminis TaxID=1173586 RepID=A0ABX7G112_9GAMM|nr:transporter substrate-binding domain-containing protein [Shewanella litorisediminis]MCL2919866.1 transporter substrate-binding domain-containing protein [Shewanella litorisediminis]QRH00907.1 ABC transporter substrate-binding protein [Shewanella litorisediminis]
MGYTCYLLLTALLCFSLMAKGEAADPTAPIRLRLLTEPLPPLSYLEGEKATGYAVELVEHLKARLNEGANIEVLPWARAYSVASQLPNILLFSTALRDSRRSQFDFVGPIATARIKVYKLATDTDIPTSLDAAAEYGSLGVYRGSPSERILKKSGVKNVEVSSYPLQSLRQLLAGRVRYWCQADLAVSMLLSQAGTTEFAITPLFELERVELYLAFSRGTPALTVQQWHQALADFQEEGGFAELYERWFNMPVENTQSHILWHLTPED